MFLEDILLESDDDILEEEELMEGEEYEDDDLDLFSEALSFGTKSTKESNKSGAGIKKGFRKPAVKEKPLTKKEKVIKAVKNIDKKKVTKIIGVIGGALATGAIIIAAAKKIKASKAAKDGQIDTKAVDEKVGIVKQAMGKLKTLRTKFTKAEKLTTKEEPQKALSGPNRKLLTASDKKLLPATKGAPYSPAPKGNPVTQEDIAEVNKHVVVIKKIYGWFVSAGKAAGCKLSGAKNAVKQKFMAESTLMENEDYSVAFEYAMDGSIEEFNTYMENVELDSFLNEYVVEEVIEALESGAYDEDEEVDDYDFDF